MNKIGNLIIGKIDGGLGNQMFQYAFYKYLQSLKSSQLALDLSAYKKGQQHNGYELASVFKISEEEAAANCVESLQAKNPIFYKVQQKVFGRSIFGHPTHFSEHYFRIDPDVFHVNKSSLYIEGYFQTAKYIEKIKDLKLFELGFGEIIEARELDIRQPSSVSIHIRGGDYLVSRKNRRMFQGACDAEYYKKAINRIEKICAAPRFFVFTNDEAYARDLLSDRDVTYVNWNTGEKSYRDMFLMSRCAHNIVANSSFSWWAAYLNKNVGKTVIAPKRWLNNLRYNQREIVPASWERI